MTRWAQPIRLADSPLRCTLTISALMSSRRMAPMGFDVERPVLRQEAPEKPQVSGPISALKELPGHDEALDLVRHLVDLGDLGVAGRLNWLAVISTLEPMHQRDDVRGARLWREGDAQAAPPA